MVRLAKQIDNDSLLGPPATPATKEVFCQFRQSVAIATFKDCHRRNTSLTKPMSEVIKVFRLQQKIRQWIFSIRIESSGHQYEIRTKLYKSLENLPYFTTI